MNLRAMCLCVGLPLSVAMAQVEVKKDEQGHKAVAVADDGSHTPGRPGSTRVGEWTTMGPFGGDVWAVAASPTAANVALAGLAPGGSFGGSLYRSTDGGATWSIVAQQASRSVFDVEFAPDGTAYIGTMDGVWKSTDDGATWAELPLGIGLNDQTFEVTLDPTNPQVLWAGVADAIGSQMSLLMYSDNGGASWTDRTPPLSVLQTCRAVAINPNNTQEMAAAFGGAFGGGQVWVSTDGGLSWTDRSAGLPNNPMNTVVHDGTRFLVGGGQLFGSQFVGVFGSQNLGATWTALHTASWPSRVVNKIAVDPASASTIYAATTAGVFKTTDGGSTWEFGVGGTGPISALTVAPAGGPGTVFMGGSSVGVYKSTDAGGTFGSSTSGIISLDVFSIAANPLNPQDMAIAFQGQNNGGVFRSTDGGQSWSLENLPGTRYMHVSYGYDGTLHALSTGPTTIAQEGVYRRNGDGTWSALGPNQGPNFDVEAYSMRFSRNNPDLILVGASDFGAVGWKGTIWRSDNAGSSWTKVHLTPNDFNFVSDIEIVEDGTDQSMLASVVDNSGNRMGGVLRSVDNGVSWAPVTNGLPALIQARSLSNAGSTATTFYVSNSDNGSGFGLYKSTDAGVSWAPTGFAQTVGSMDADWSDPQTVYIVRPGSAGVQDRVHKSTDGGATFSLFSDGLLAQSGFSRQLVFAGGSSPKLLLATNKSSFKAELGGGCYANCDASTTDPVLNVADFTCFLQRFGAGESYANCDGSTTEPVLNVADFSCFLQSFAGGCR